MAPNGSTGQPCEVHSVQIETLQDSDKRQWKALEELAHSLSETGQTLERVNGRIDTQEALQNERLRAAEREAAVEHSNRSQFKGFLYRVLEWAGTGFVAFLLYLGAHHLGIV